jgi:hypothetical protein
MKVIGLAGVARSGKDTFCAIAKKLITEKGLTVERFALADDLKSDLEPFLKDKLGINVWTSDPVEKTLIRPFMVWYGCTQRQLSNGTYWINRVAKKINESKVDVAIVTDVRFENEMRWLQQTMEGRLIHVSKFAWGITGVAPKVSGSQRIKMFVEPPNEEERANDPKMKMGADYIVEWEHRTVKSEQELINHPELNETVELALRAVKVL